MYCGNMSSVSPPSNHVLLVPRAVTWFGGAAAHQQVVHGLRLRKGRLDTALPSWLYIDAGLLMQGAGMMSHAVPVHSSAQIRLQGSSTVLPCAAGQSAAACALMDVHGRLGCPSLTMSHSDV